MALSQKRSKRKVTGSKYKRSGIKTLSSRGSPPSLTRLADRKTVRGRERGGSVKTRLLSASVANLCDTNAKKYLKARITTIIESPANRHFVRRNIMTKGALIETDKGKAKITSRPGQEGTVNAVLV